MNDRCPKCGHTWDSSHAVRRQGLTYEPFCWVAGCDCTMEAPQQQKALPAGGTA